MDDLESLQQRMEAAAALDFEQARALRDRITLLRGGATPAFATSPDSAGLERQRPGAVGLGTSQQKVTPPEGWKLPPQPDLVTKRRSKRR